jgi:quercetin dioxygenase-like cupin family protein
MVSKLEPISIDSRRALTEFGLGGNWKVCKYLEITEDCVIGHHYHKLKDESFFLSKGSGNAILGGSEYSIKAPCFIDVPRGIYHAFNLEKGSILIGLASEEHDPSDDYRV